MQRKFIRDAIDGVLLLDKPVGITSNAALQRVRRLLNAAKAGHTGTLDPMASGLLPLTFGESTKFSQRLLDADKVYEASVRLGIDTDSGDADGQVLAEHEPVTDEALIHSVIAGFVGEIEQLPPMYSALKRDGKALYEYARAGIEVERTPRKVCIHSIEVLGIDGPIVRIRTHVSKGTYIRSLAMDVGQALGCGAHLSALRRTAIGPFRVDDAVTLDALEALDASARRAQLAPVDALLAALPTHRLSAGEAGALLNGAVLSQPALAPGEYRAYGPTGFLGLVEVDAEGRLRSRRLVTTMPASHANKLDSP